MPCWPCYLRDDALLSLPIPSHHREALPGARLSVREDADVVPLEGVLQHLNADVIVDLLLVGKLRVIRLQPNQCRINNEADATGPALLGIPVF